MKPYYDQDGITIYHGDCREVLPTLGSFDLLLTDPPYGHGSKWGGGTWAADQMYKDAMEWDALPAPLELVESCIGLADWSVVWGGNYYALPGARCYLAWSKINSVPTMADFELAWTNFDRPAKSWRETVNPDGKRVHPTQKPMTLFRWCIQQAPAGCRTILDPFMGSGTTLLAARDLGRKAVGIEREEKYCAAAVDRLRQGVLAL
jgi:DNA modification methylase